MTKHRKIIVISMERLTKGIKWKEHRTLFSDILHDSMNEGYLVSSRNKIIIFIGV